ncbi:hypothetical protein RyT2_05860 [Pseudolactococcus yaeyamensis]
MNQKTVIPNGYHVLQGMFSQNEDIKNIMSDFVAANPDYRLFDTNISVESSDLVYLGLAEQARKFVVEFSENPTLAEGQEVTKELIEKIISIDSLNEFSRGYDKLYIDEVFQNGEVTESEPYLRIDLGDGLVENKQYYLDLAKKIGLTPKDIGFGKSQEDIQLDLQAVEFSDSYKNSEKVPQDLTLVLEDSESLKWADDSRLFVRAELQDIETEEPVIYTPFVVDNPRETDFLTWWQDNYKAIDKQVRSSDDVVALEKKLDFRRLPKLEQEKILDEQNGVLNLFDDENNSSKLNQIVDQIDIEEDTQVTEQQTQEKSIPTKEEDNSRLAQAQRKLERLEREMSEATDEMYAHQKLTNGQPMNDKRNGPAWFKRREELERKARNLDSELKDHRDRVDRLEQQVFNKEHGLNKQGTGLEMSVGNIDNIKRAIETGELIEGNKAKLSGETIKKYQKELVRLEEMKHNSEKVQGVMSDATKALITSGDIKQWIKQPTLYFVNGLQKVALELDAETGEFKISQKYAPKTQTDKDFVDNLLAKYNAEKVESISTLQEVLDDLDNHPELLPEVTELEKSLTDVSRYDGVDKDSPAIAELQSKMGLGSAEFVSENRAKPTVENDEVEVGKIITQISDGFVTMSQRAPLDSEPDKIDLAILDERMNTIQSFSVGVLNVTAGETKEERREQTAYHLLGELAQASEIGQNDLSAINVISTFSLLDTPEVSVTFEDVEKVEELAKAFSKAKIVEEIVEKSTENTVTPYKSKDITVEQMMNDAAVQIREYSKNPADLKSYMDFMSNFPQYSAKNNALLRRQWHGAVAVASFDQWAKLGDKLGIRSDDLETDRVTFKNEKTGEEKVIENGSLSVKKGEKSNIYLFRPQTTKVIPLLDENGKQKKNDKGYPMFKPSFKATAEEKAKIANGTLKIESRPRIAEGKVQFAKFPVYDITQTNLKSSSYPKAMPNRKVDYDVDIDSANNMMRGLKAY